VTIRLASIGDSFTEGVGDETPEGEPIGWADRVALGLASAMPDDDVYYVNMAIRGRLQDAIVHEQLDVVLALDPLPTRVTFNGGGNDMMRPGYSDERMTAMIRRVFDECAVRGVQVVILSGADPFDRLPGGKRLRRLGDRLTVLVDELSQREGVTFVDNFRDVQMRDSAYWSVDRLHLNTVGHRRVASRVLTALGVPTELPVATAHDAAPSGLRGELAYWHAYVLPWIGRRLTGRSSGDGRSPKYPQWTRVSAEGIGVLHE